MLIYEEYELFGESVFHCSTTDKAIAVADVLGSFLSLNRCLVFEEKEDRIAATAKQVLKAIGRQVFILGLCAEIDEILTWVPSDNSIPPLSQHFEHINTSLSSDFAVIRCLSLPAALENVDISSETHSRITSAESKEVEIQLGGGLCVNKASNAYILGYGPKFLICDGTPGREGEQVRTGFRRNAGRERHCSNCQNRRYLVDLDFTLPKRVPTSIWLRAG